MNDAPTPNQNPESDALHARLGHECFRQPTDALAKVWRYMSLPKFISLLTSNSLYMARLDKLVDQHEGSLTRRTVEEIDAYLKAAGSTKGWTEENAAFHERSRSNTFVCCWHLNEHESEAMWRLHCGSAGGVAVQTTYSNLVESISKEYDTYVGIVRYVDYATAVFESGNAFWPVMHKRAAFTHEQEVRLVRYWGDPPYPDTSPSEPTPPMERRSTHNENCR